VSPQARPPARNRPPTTRHPQPPVTRHRRAQRKFNRIGSGRHNPPPTFGIVVAILVALSWFGGVIMSNGAATMKAIAGDHLPGMQLATAFEREVLNARIHSAEAASPRHEFAESVPVTSRPVN
jgi:hypothetical protein